MVDVEIAMPVLGRKMLVDQRWVAKRFKFYAGTALARFAEPRHCTDDPHDLVGQDGWVRVPGVLLIPLKVVPEHAQRILQTVFPIAGKHPRGDIGKFVKIE